MFATFFTFGQSMTADFAKLIIGAIIAFAFLKADRSRMYNKAFDAFVVIFFVFFLSDAIGIVHDFTAGSGFHS